jgi:hypothetical protein
VDSKETSHVFNYFTDKAFVEAPKIERERDDIFFGSEVNPDFFDKDKKNKKKTPIVDIEMLKKFRTTKRSMGFAEIKFYKKILTSIAKDGQISEDHLDDLWNHFIDTKKIFEKASNILQKSLSEKSKIRLNFEELNSTFDFNFTAFLRDPKYSSYYKIRCGDESLAEKLSLFVARGFRRDHWIKGIAYQDDVDLCPLDIAKSEDYNKELLFINENVLNFFINIDNHCYNLLPA